VPCEDELTMPIRAVEAWLPQRCRGAPDRLKSSLGCWARNTEFPGHSPWKYQQGELVDPRGGCRGRVIMLDRLADARMDDSLTPRGAVGAQELGRCGFLRAEISRRSAISAFRSRAKRRMEDHSSGGGCR
jgi:hypothetical protein